MINSKHEALRDIKKYSKTYHNSQCPGRDTNLEPSKHAAEA
jgi:hypothetical protein